MLLEKTQKTCFFFSLNKFTIKKDNIYKLNVNLNPMPTLFTAPSLCNDLLS